MSGTYPTSVTFRGIDLRSNRNNARSRGQSGRTQVRNLGGQYWSFTAQHPPLNRADYSTVFAFIMQQGNGSESFQMRVPEWSDATGTMTGTLLVNNVSGYAAGSTSIAADGGTGTLPVGDFLKFANHNKVYMVTSGITDAGTIQIQPPLQAAVVDNEAITYDNVEFTVRLANDVQEYSVGVDSLVELEVDVEEVI